MNTHLDESVRSREGEERHRLDEALFSLDDPEPARSEIPPELLEVNLSLEESREVSASQGGEQPTALTSVGPGVYELGPAEDPVPEDLPAPIQIQLPPVDFLEKIAEAEEIPAYEWPDAEREIPGVEETSEERDSEESSVDETAQETEPRPPVPVSAVPVQPLQLVANTGLTLAPGETAALSPAELQILGASTPFLVDIMLLSPPEKGVLLRDGFALTGGDVFTQEDLDHGRIHYRHDGEVEEEDSFTFATPQGEIEPTVFLLRMVKVHRAPELLGPGRLPRLLDSCRIADILEGTVRSSVAEQECGLALVGIFGKGQWFTSPDQGRTWREILEVQPSRALLLGPGDLLRFVPRTGWTGKVGLTYRAWDGTQETAGEYLDLSSRRSVGGTTAFSEAVGTVTMTVRVTSLRLSVPEPWNAQPTAEELVGEGMAVVRLEGAGTWQFSLDDGRTWFDFGPVYHGRARLLGPRDRVRFLPAREGTGKVILTARLWDGTGGTPGECANLARHGAFGEATPFGECAQSRGWRLGGE